MSPDTCPEFFDHICSGCQFTYPHHILIFATHLYISTGIGTKTNATIPRTVLPQPASSFSYSGGPANGKKAPAIDTATLRVATAEAEYVEYASIRYC